MAPKTRPAPERFWDKVNTAGPLPPDPWVPLETRCWLWTAQIGAGGYGQFWAGDRTPAGNPRKGIAHRYAYELLVGPIPEGFHIDHLCRVRHCVNPLHLEAVTARTNNLRSDSLSSRMSRRTHCVNGHPFDGVNSYWNGRQRRCRACGRDVARRHRDKEREMIQTKKEPV